MWLDHLSFEVTNYKESASFYSNLLGWKETYDEGSQHELMIGEVGDVIVRGGNPNSPEFGKGDTARGRSAQVGEPDLRLSQAIPCQPGLRTQPTERLIRNILQAGVEEGILLPGFVMAGLQVGHDSPEDRGQVHAMSAVA